MDPDKVGRIEPNLPSDANESDAHRFEFGNNNAAYIETPRTKELQKMSKEDLIGMVEILQAQLKKSEELSAQKSKDITTLKGEEDYRDDKETDYASNYSSDNTETDFNNNKNQSVDVSRLPGYSPDESRKPILPKPPPTPPEPNIYRKSELPPMQQSQVIDYEEMNKRLKAEKSLIRKFFRKK